MISYKIPDAQDTKSLWELMNTIDEETDYMMYEPGERRALSDHHILQKVILSAAKHDNLFLAAMDNEKYVGYLSAVKGTLKRTSHTAYIVIGILHNYTGQGIGTTLFSYLDEWANEKNLVRLELTVECPNEAAIHLYKKSGFKVEGIRKKSMLVHETYIDEYYMSKIL